MMSIDFHRDFSKIFRKLPESIKRAATSRIGLFQGRPFHPLLNNHSLAGKYSGCRSINITGDFRAVYRTTDDRTALFITIGTHSQLYRK